jgi:MFS transporter, DHA1 family, multidrug resistance protein
MTNCGLITSTAMPRLLTTPAAPAAAPAVTVNFAAFALALLLGLQPLSTDTYLPALPMLTREWAAPQAAVQLTMSALILAFGLAQMFWGPLADRLGRKPVLLMGLALYTAASVGCAMSNNIHALVLWRAAQGAALAAAVVCARAVVRDLYEPQQGAQVMARALTGLGAMALLSPLLGGWAVATWSWRAPLVVVAAVGGLTFLFIALQWPESLHKRNPAATALRPLLRQWWAIARHPEFVAWALLVTCTYGGLFTILAASSFAYMDTLGLAPTAYGGVMAVGSGTYLLSTLLCRRWIAQRGMVATVWRGAWFSLLGGVLMVGFVATGVHTVWAVLLAHCLFLFGHGLHQPCGQAGVVAPFPQAAGTASALAGLMLALVAFGIGRWLGISMDGSLRPMAYTLGLWAVLTSAVALFLVQRVNK